MLAEADLLAAARAGDRAGFGALVAPHCSALTAHCYRLTGSLADAEDAVQDALVRAWRGLPGFEGRSSVRTWLLRIATHACLSALESRQARALPSDLGAAADPAAPPPGPLLDPVWLDPCPEPLWTSDVQGPDARYASRESVTVAFVAALQLLPPLQRAVLLLRDVLGFSAEEAADLLDTSAAAANSALQRARATLEARRDRIEDGRALAPDDEQARELLRRYVAAWESGDAAALAALLREDAVLTMPPVPAWYAGRDAVASFLGAMWPKMGASRLRPVAVSGGLGVAAWGRAPGEVGWKPRAIHALTAGTGGLLRLDVFLDPAVFGRFSLSVATGEMDR